MQTKSLSILFFLILVAMSVPLSTLEAGHPGLSILQEKRTAKEKKGTQVNQEDNKPGKKEMKMDGLSLAAHISTTTGIASLFLVPVAGAILIGAGFIMGIIAWVDKKRSKNRKGQGLALASVAVGGSVVLLMAVSIVAFLLSGGF